MTGNSMLLALAVSGDHCSSGWHDGVKNASIISAAFFVPLCTLLIGRCESAENEARADGDTEVRRELPSRQLFVFQSEGKLTKEEWRIAEGIVFCISAPDQEPLRWLDLSRTSVSDRSVPSLSGLIRLRYLGFHGTKISKKGGQQLRKSLRKTHLVGEGVDPLSNPNVSPMNLLPPQVSGCWDVSGTKDNGGRSPLKMKTRE